MSTSPKKRETGIPWPLGSALTTSAAHPLPKSSPLLSQIIEALLKRIAGSRARTSKSREVGRIRAILQELAAIELVRARTPWPDGSFQYISTHALKIDDDMLRASESRLIKELSKPNHSKTQHLVSMLRLQCNFLLQFMESNGYQGLASNPQEEWFERTQGKYWFSMLTSYPCICQYPQTIKEVLYSTAQINPLSDFSKIKDGYEAAPGYAIYYILANLHQTTVNQIKTLLKQPLKDDASRPA
ncbi:MAG: hypothetical protein NDI90_15640 [Nitrospira sp. BO4]|nr:hypothetical protein [Nitrospira sp. BO4]